MFTHSEQKGGNTLALAHTCLSFEGMLLTEYVHFKHDDLGILK